MKTIKNLVVFVMMLTIATGYANENYIDGSNKVITVLKFSNVKKGHQYTIKDNQGFVIYSKTIDRNGTYTQEFDFTALADGLYTFEIIKDFEITVKPFQIAAEQVLFLHDMETKEFKPVVRLENHDLMISHLTLEEKPLVIELFFNGELIYADELKGSKILKRIYKLSAEEKGSYFLRLKSGNRLFTDSFKM